MSDNNIKVPNDEFDENNKTLGRADFEAAAEDIFLSYLEYLNGMNNKHLGAIIATATQLLITNPPDDSTPEGKPIFNERGEFVYHASDANGTMKVLTVRSV